ncbi:MAG: rhomboid family intramembrane serine protease [Rhodospirillales bacterium]|nr:rhomboid family intramembrane serine protease [Rhodospirillales bacterium]
MPFVPLGDSNARVRISRPFVSYALLASCFLIYLYQSTLTLQADGVLVYGFGLIPAVLTGEAQLSRALEQVPAWMTLISYQFLHGGWDHLIGNLLFLWVFSDNVEDSLGHIRFPIFYISTGIVAGFAHAAIEPGSEVPLIGASGAISGVLGAYLVLHPFARLVVLLFFIPLVLPAWLLLAGWFGFQFFAAQADGTGPVAWWAHIGGFAAGAVLVVFFRQRGVPLIAREQPKGITFAFPRSGHPPPEEPIQEAPQSHRSPRPEEPPPGPWGKRRD